MLPRTPPPQPPHGRASRAPKAETWAAALGLDLLALLWPVACVGCGAADRALCRTCRAEVWDAARSPAVLRIPGVGVPGFAAAPYAGAVRRVLLAYKHGGAHGHVRLLGRRLAVPLAAALAEVTRAEPGSAGPPLAQAAQAARAPRAPQPLGESGSPPVPPAGCSSPPAGRLHPHAGQPVLVVPLPSRPQKVRERGFRHVDDLVRIAVRHAAPAPQALPAVRVVRALATTPGRTGQVGLPAAARERNARLVRLRAGARAAVRGRAVVLVDDIATTGATLREASRALECAGARVLAVVVVCAAVRRDAP